MKGTATQIGRYGEDLAAAHLIEHGFTITRRNYRVGRCEIDIIAENEKYILFVEVKTRSIIDPAIKSQYGRPGRAVTYDKKVRTLTAARTYLHDHPTQKWARMDVMELYLKQSDSTAPQLLKLEWITNAYRKR